MRALLVVLALGLSWPVQAMEWEWLDQMRDAIQNASYQGEYVHRRGDQTSAYAIAHTVRDGEPVERLQQLDGAMIEVIRHGNQVVCYYPAGAEDQIDRPIPAAPFSQVGPMALDRLAQSYQAQAQGEARVAGRQARILTLSADAWRYSHRLWLDQDTGLLLQSEILSADGEVLEQFRYTRLSVGGPIAESALQPTIAGSTGRQQSRVQMPMPEPNTDAFVTTLSWMPPMFKLTMAERTVSADGWLEKRVYSDGLATFSMFVEPAMAAEPDSLVRMGATTALMSDINGLTVTVIGEIPRVTAERLRDSVSRLQ
ncbi:MucB/RseB C-terminal domain-containing protein [Saccharospirillum mangrovi]|uniref:MucB/RseB C-terminal domain-containing protein n=1 Tax=Saccharospirillum mangrovi TaxID=2161747 RepID=UPI000D33EFD4|nr:MucB/RseB C-terminal domain-containing protein [Saccharospirillum mangrovi]